MSILATFRLKLLIIWINILRTCLPYSRGNNVAARSVHYIHPASAKQKPLYYKGLKLRLQRDKDIIAAWNRHLALIGVQRFQSAFYAGNSISWIHQCHVDVEGKEHLEKACQQGKGVLAMTYHHHFNMLFCNLLATLGHPVTTIAMDDRGSKRYQKFGKRVNRIYENAEKLLNGGDIILVKPKKQVRPILRAFEKHHLVITANDFPTLFDDKNRKDFPFMGTTLSCPTGTVKLAAKKQIPMVACYLNWAGGDSFRLVIKPVSDGNKSVTMKKAMKCYLKVLEELIAEDPGLWEGWKWLSP